MRSTVVPVTGAASGIGRAVCERLRGEGATPLLLDRDEARLEAAAAEIYPQETDGTCYAYRLDVRDSRAVEACLDEITRAHGRVTHGVACAGIGGPANALTVTDEDWHRVIDVNLHGAMHFCRAVARQLAAERRGSIVTIASLAGLRAKEDRVSYSASKAAVVNMTRAFAVDLGSLGIRANAVAPGVIDTPIQEGNRDSFDAISGRIPLARIGVPDDVANAVLFLLSDLSSYVTGHTLVVDGGMTAKYR